MVTAKTDNGIRVTIKRHWFDINADLKRSLERHAEIRVDGKKIN